MTEERDMKSMEDREQSGSDLSIFRALEPERREKLIRSGAMVCFSKGEPLFLDHSPATAFFIIQSGRVKLRRVSNSGHEVVLHLAGAGHLIGSTALAGSGQNYALDAIAFEPVTALRFCRRQFLEAASGKPEVFMSLLSDLSSRLEDIYTTRETMHKPVPQRIAALLIKQALPPDVASVEWTRHPLNEVRLTKSQVATFVGTTTETATRILSKWRKRGLIDSGRGRLSLKNPAEIYQLSRGLPA